MRSFINRFWNKFFKNSQETSEQIGQKVLLQQKKISYLEGEEKEWEIINANIELYLESSTSGPIFELKKEMGLIPQEELGLKAKENAPKKNIDSKDS